MSMIDGGVLRAWRGGLVVVRDGDDGEVVEEREQDDVERLEGVVVHERDDAEEGDHLHRDADAVDDVRLEALEDAARLHDGGEDGREALAREDDVGGGLRGVGGAGDGDADLRLGEGGRVVDAVAGHADDLAHALEDGDDLVLVLGHHLREAVGLDDQVVARGAPGQSEVLAWMLTPRSTWRASSLAMLRWSPVIILTSTPSP